METLKEERDKRKREKRKKEAKQKQEQEQEEEKMPDYDPPSPVYDPDQKEETMQGLTPQEKIVLDPNYHSLNYTPKQEDAPTLVNNLVTLAKEEDQKEDKAEEQDKDKEKEHEKRTK